RIARREMRAGFGGFRILIAGLALGVAAIAAIGSMNEAVVLGLKGESRKLLGGDVDLRLHNRPAGFQEMAFLESTSRKISRTMDMRAMAFPAKGGGGRRLVELKGVDENYPLTGTIELDRPLTINKALARENGTWGAVADANLLDRLGIAIGQRVRVGDAEFQIRARILSEPDRVASIIRFGPRLMVSYPALETTGLVQPGSQIHYHYRIELALDDFAAWIERLKAEFPTAGWRIRGTDQAAPGLQRFIERMTLFLAFAGMTALLVGGIGVANSVKSFVDGKSDTIATLKCLGASGGLVFRTYLYQVMALGFIGIAIGLVLGAIAPAAITMAMAGVFPIAPKVGLYPMPLIVAASFGLLTVLTFAVWPLGRAREVPAGALFRQRIQPSALKPRYSYRVFAGGCAAALAGLAIVSASDKYFAAWFVGGAFASLLVLRSGAALLIAAAGRLPRPPGAKWRLALANLHRPGISTADIFLSLGLGLSVLVAVVLIEGNLSHQINERLPEEAPAFFFVDIQPHQAGKFDQVVLSQPGTSNLQRAPSLRGRIVRIDGVPVDKAKISPATAWAVRGDRALTYAAKAPDHAEIVAGEWWPPDYRGEPVISLDAKLARGFGVGLGDTLTLNVLGREIEATITSLRQIDWRSLRFDFAIIFAPGALEGSPHTYIAAVQASRASEENVEKAVTETFKNISAIRVREALEAAARILEGIGVAVRATSMIAILSGALVLGGAIAAGQRLRIHDCVVFKVLGATRPVILQSLVIEFCVLGIATGLTAAAIGTTIAWAVIRFLMHAPWIFLPGVVAATLIACLALTIVAGFAGTWRALGEKASVHLRNE
ncbi:MAG: FtsX-like permease family protein, partial [Rhodospirillales bacterium]